MGRVQKEGEREGERERQARVLLVAWRFAVVLFPWERASTTALQTIKSPSLYVGCMRTAPLAQLGIYRGSPKVRLPKRDI